MNLERRRSGKLVAACFLLLSLMLTGTVQAREAAREDFGNVPEAARGGQVPGKDGKGKGWTQADPSFHVVNPPVIERPVSFDNTVRRGAISFDLQRKTGDIAPEYRTVFALKDASERNLLLLQVSWNSPFDPRFPSFAIKGGPYYESSLGMWSPWLLLDRAVRPGQWIHVDLTWDDTVREYHLYIDGRRVDTSPKTFVAATDGNHPDMREVTNSVLAVQGRRPMYYARPFRDLLTGTKSIRFGVNTVPEAPNRGTSPLSNSVLANFVVLADELPKGLAGLPVISSVTDDSFRVPGISGKLVAGDKVTVTMKAPPGGKASFDMGNAKGIPLSQVTEGQAVSPGPAPTTAAYQGSYTVRPGDDFENGRVIGRYVASDNVIAEPAASASVWTIETKPRVTFHIDNRDLSADTASKARIRLVARDANGNPVSGRRIKLTLATTDQYTGTVGAGDFGKQVGGSVETRWRGETDGFGEVEFDYTSGFAAKTVILSCKDLDSGGVTVDYLTAYKEASIDIALKKAVSHSAARRSAQYLLKVEASRKELTADGSSRSVIRATLQDPGGKTVSRDPVVFTLSSPNGTLRTIQGTTDSSGTATAEYTAGKKIGIVVITATATLRNAQGEVSIILLADAPAKIRLAAKPDNLPADGASRADIQVKVTDVNDNPNKDTKVEFNVVKGGGKLDYPERQTDRFGDAENRYTAGKEAGIATILATVRSSIPTEAELAKSRNVLFVPYSPESDEIRVERWMKKKGDAFQKNEGLVEYSAGRDRRKYILAAPYDGTMGDILVEYWDSAEIGQTLALLVPAAK